MIKRFAQASAPGRLDVMGGIADYSGSLVLQMPITQQTKVELTLRDDYQCNLTSFLNNSEPLIAQVDYRHYLKGDEVDYAFAQNQFKQPASLHWISYILGCALVLQKAQGIVFTGADFRLTSNVPLGKGVSSSASVEVATMKALTQAFGISLSGTLLPTLAQQVENLVVGAPCGLMDQLACYFGEPNKLLPILCQPDKIDNPISIPEDFSFIGLDSGVRHSVAGASYGDVRCAAFMGYSIIANALGVTQQELQSAKSKNDFSSLPYGGFLCNISVKQFEKNLLHLLPDFVSGKDFIEQFGVSIDPVTTLAEDTVYSIKQCVAHPIYENARVHTFKDYLSELNDPTARTHRKGILKKMGELMYQSHESYSQCGLGSDRTDEIVLMAKEFPGVYGAKITGGGNGGTVCLLVDADGKKSVHRIHQYFCEKYKGDFMLFES
jgi:galactokinase